MESSSTSMIHTLIIETRTDGKPDLFVPMMVVSEDRNKLIKHMTDGFNNWIVEFNDDLHKIIDSAFMDETCARIDYREILDNKSSVDHSIYWTVCASKLI